MKATSIRNESRFKGHSVNYQYDYFGHTIIDVKTQFKNDFLSNKEIQWARLFDEETGKPLMYLNRKIKSDGSLWEDDDGSMAG